MADAAAPEAKKGSPLWGFTKFATKTAVVVTALSFVFTAAAAAAPAATAASATAQATTASTGGFWANMGSQYMEAYNHVAGWLSGTAAPAASEAASHTIERASDLIPK